MPEITRRLKGLSFHDAQKFTDGNKIARNSYSYKFRHNTVLV